MMCGGWGRSSLESRHTAGLSLLAEGKHLPSVAGRLWGFNKIGEGCAAA
jgi:hypothetical protein